MTGSPIHVGMVSAAHYHASFWATAFIEDPRCRLLGVLDDHPDRGRALAEAHGTQHHDSLDALLDVCDAVGITSETSRHADLVKMAVSHGVHVLLEKPMARSLSDARRIATAVRSAGTIFVQNLPKALRPGEPSPPGDRGRRHVGPALSGTGPPRQRQSIGPRFLGPGSKTTHLTEPFRAGSILDPEHKSPKGSNGNYME